jgi:hypothetical protein
VLVVKGLTEGKVASTEEALALIQQGQENRKVRLFGPELLQLMTQLEVLGLESRADLQFEATGLHRWGSIVAVAEPQYADASAAM